VVIVTHAWQSYNLKLTCRFVVPGGVPVLAEPARTPYDLNFRLLGFRVRVHPFFWLGAGLLGGNFLQVSFAAWLIWIAVVFVSIIVHELGHAIAFRRFGRNASIVLYAFGGLAVPDSVVGGRMRRILVSLAGPFAGFVLAGLVYGSDQLAHWSSKENGSLVPFFYVMLIYVNLYWGIFNLLPVFPLDGGQVASELCEARWPARGFRISLQISVWVAAAIAVYSFVCEYETRTQQLQLLKELPWWFPRGGMYSGILFLILAVQSYQLLQQLGRGMYYEAPDDRTPWER
jgi:Zn-dependent protease